MVFIIIEIFQRIKFWKEDDRVGIDNPYTYWRLYFKSTMKKLCQKKFRSFADSAEFRPGAHSYACSKIDIGKRVVIRPFSVLAADPEPGGGDIIIEDDVMFGPGISIYVNNHRYDDTTKPIIDQGYSISKRVHIKKGVWIGANAIILPGVTIGENSVVGAGSVVTKSIPPRCVAVGVPARVVKEIGKEETGKDNQNRNIDVKHPKKIEKQTT